MNDSNAPGAVEPLRDLWECVYCGSVHPSPNGTGSDVVCCGEIGHVQPTTWKECDADF